MKEMKDNRRAGTESREKVIKKNRVMEMEREKKRVGQTTTGLLRPVQTSSNVMLECMIRTDEHCLQDISDTSAHCTFK